MLHLCGTSCIFSSAPVRTSTPRPSSLLARAMRNWAVGLEGGRRDFDTLMLRRSMCGSCSELVVRKRHLVCAAILCVSRVRSAYQMLTSDNRHERAAAETDTRRVHGANRFVV